ncbi:mannose-6-phosphate isomerase, class I [Rhodococcus sp. F64268]|uniref:mannose-6-phosphate isomerase, class I n=1 Tax=Rhodococcus sp. F64268 TaxID=2926402 RepID=UPI001FF2DEF5|nr:mannose-6-phosphate isomerase, class I [Rhodococcus sp. F64268]MCK0090491.1 mannose-6-phosphate isomerase, class I [Rhodococcus sp. F64268]
MGNGLQYAQRLHGIIQPYSWGSRTVLAELMGRPSPTGSPEAELWLGTHPNGPSVLQCGASLQEAISESPESALGSHSLSQFGAQLPFLLKVLAAETALSLQAHPTLEQARVGFARENAAGVPIHSPIRNYRDDNHKPELLVALTEFHALAGFRDVTRTVALIDALRVPELSGSAEELESHGLRTVFERWVSLNETDVHILLSALLKGCTRYLHAYAEGDFRGEAKMLLDLADQYPGDLGILAALLLNQVKLEPGEGIYLDAGHLHAYVCGTGVEIMANSDNVLRGGMTSKNVDRDELMRVLRFDPITPPIVRAEPLADPSWNAVILQYPTPAREFRLRRVEIDGRRAVGSDGARNYARCPQILLCTKGTCRISIEGVDTIDFGSSFSVAQGESVWVPAGATVSFSSTGVDAQVFIASVP